MIRLTKPSGEFSGTVATIKGGISGVALDSDDGILIANVTMEDGSVQAWYGYIEEVPREWVRAYNSQTFLAAYLVVNSAWVKLSDL